MLNVSASTVKTEEEEHDHSQSSGSENSSYSEANFEEKLEELESKVMKLIEYVMNDINKLKKKTSRKKRSNQEVDKENIIDDKWKRRIYVGNINPITSIEQLSSYFTKSCGEVVHAYYFRFFPTNRNAFVEFKIQSSVDMALNQKHIFQNRDLTVGPARRRNDNEFLKDHQSFKAKSTDYKILRYRPY